MVRKLLIRDRLARSFDCGILSLAKNLQYSVMKVRRSPQKETAHADVVVLAADDFQVGPSYDNWRPKGTSDWLLIFTIDGAGQVGSGKTEVISRAATVTLYQPGSPQRYLTAPSSRRWRFLWSHFHPRPHWGVWLKWPEVAPGFRAIHLKDAGVIRNVRAAMTDTIRLSRQHFSGSMDLAVNALERALLWIDSAHDQTTRDERVRRAVDLMAEKLREPFSLEEMARTCGISSSRLAHLFREQIGVPPQQYLGDLRLQRAAQLLRSTGLTVGEIAEEAGYTGAFYFSSRFRKRFGLSPTSYRASQTGGHQSDASC